MHKHISFFLFLFEKILTKVNCRLYCSLYSVVQVEYY